MTPVELLRGSFSHESHCHKLAGTKWLDEHFIWAKKRELCHHITPVPALAQIGGYEKMINLFNKKQKITQHFFLYGQNASLG